MVFAFSLLLFFQLLVYLKQYAETEVVSDYFKARQLLHKVVYKLKTLSSIQLVDFECKESI